jgi:hypothetical protein
MARFRSAGGTGLLSGRQPDFSGFEHDLGSGGSFAGRPDSPQATGLVGGAIGIRSAL